MDNNNGKKAETTIRARNKTVMLSPELAGQVRAKMANEFGKVDPQATQALPSEPQVQRPVSPQPPPQQQSHQAPPQTAFSSQGGQVGVGQASRPVQQHPVQPAHQPVANDPRGTPAYRQPNQQGIPVSTRATTPLGDVRRAIPESAFGSPPGQVQQTRRAPEPVNTQDSLNVDYGNEQVAKPAPSAHSAPPPVQRKVVEQAPVFDDHSDEGSDGVKAIYTKMTPIIGFLVSFDQDKDGEHVPLRSGRLMVTSDYNAGNAGAPAGQWNVLHIPDDSVSGMHAIMRVQQGELHIMDQLSEGGTRITKGGAGSVEELTNSRGIAVHGDKVQFGQRSFTVLLLSQSGSEGLK